MKPLLITLLFITLAIQELPLQAKSDLSGKNLFYNSKGKYRSCNYCHSIDGSSRRFNLETGLIDSEEGRKIPSLKGIGKRKDQDQIQRSVQMMKKMFGFKLTDEQISQLVEYLGSL